MTGASKRCAVLKTKPLPHVRLASSHTLTPNTKTSIMYDPQMVQPFRDELTTLGVKELLSPEDVTTTLAESGTTLVFVNSVCGCAAAGARPGLRLAMINEKKPDRFVTVFAGMEAEATAKATADRLTLRLRPTISIRSASSAAIKDRAVASAAPISVMAPQPLE